MTRDLTTETSTYKKGFEISITAHVCVLFLLFVASILRSLPFFRPKEKPPLPPIEFTIEIPDYMVEQAQPEPEKTAPKPPDPVEDQDSIPDPVKIPDKPEIKEPEKPKPPKIVKKPIEISKKIVEKPIKKEIIKQNRIIVKPKEIIKRLPPNVKTVTNPGVRLSAKEIEKLLAMGAKASDHTSIPGDNEICLLAIKNALYAAWVMPAAEDNTGRPAEIEIRLGSTGAVLSYRLISSSGNRNFDDSALAAAAAVPAFSNLSPEFLRAYNNIVTIEFQLE